MAICPLGGSCCSWDTDSASPDGTGASPDGTGCFATGPYDDPHGHQGEALEAMSAGTHVNDVFFAAACCIIVGSFIEGSSLLWRGEFVDLLDVTFLMLLGVCLAVLDLPLMKTLMLTLHLKKYIGKYIQFITRVTGKGVTLVFLGSSLYLMMWNNLRSNIMRFWAGALCLVPAMVGWCAIFIGALKSRKLESARKQVAQVIDQKYDEMAQTFPGQSGGLTLTEFNRLTDEHGGGVTFESADLKLIYNALVWNPSGQQRVSAPTLTQSSYQSVAGGDEESQQINALSSNFWFRQPSRAQAATQSGYQGSSSADEARQLHALVSIPSSSWDEPGGAPKIPHSGDNRARREDYSLRIPKQDLLDWCRGGMVLL